MVESGEGLGQIFLGELGLEIIITIIIIIIGITQALLFKIMLSDSSEER